MASKKVKNELKEKIAQSIQEVVSTFNEKVGDKIKKSAITTAKKISNKFAKAVKEIEKSEKKAAKKTAKKEKKATKAKLKAEKRVKTPVASTPRKAPDTTPVVRRRAIKAVVAKGSPSVAAVSKPAARSRKASPKATNPAQNNGQESNES